VERTLGQDDRVPDLPARPITFAHRGARSEVAENTLPAFRRALELGASGLETDAHLSADGEVVLVHDDVVRSGMRRWRVARCDATTLAGRGIPRLAELYAELGGDFELSVDVKEPKAARGVVEMAHAAGAASRLWLCSASVGRLARLRDVTPEVRLVHSTRRRVIDAPLERHVADLASAGVDALNLHHTEWTKGIVSLVHRFGLRAFAWDVQEVRHLRAVLAMGIDGVYCDDVTRMVSTVDDWLDGGR
jgi:glycerophosphoryl diester phosphodiesterase